MARPWRLISCINDVGAGDQMGKTWQNLGAAQETMCVFTGEMGVKPWDGVRFEKRR